MNAILRMFMFFYFSAVVISCSADKDLKQADSDFQVDGLHNSDIDTAGDDAVLTDWPEPDSENDSDEIETDDVVQNDSAQDEGNDYDNEAVFLKVSVEQNPIITLTAIVEVETSKESQIFVRFYEPGGKEKNTSTTDKGFSHRIIVAGMKAETMYEFEIVALENGVENIYRTSFTTGSLPEKMPAYEFEILQPAKMTDGIIFIPSNSSNSENPEYIGVDENFDVVWYLPSSVFSSVNHSTQFLTMLDDGNLMLFNGIETVITNIGGEVIQSIQNIELGIDLHHDIKMTADGNFIALSKERRETTVEWSENPVMLISDVVVDIDRSKKIEWSWNAFDNLDTGYFPSELSRQVIGTNIYDWTHGNSIDLKNETILVSLRHQNFAVNIDRNSGSILWRLGKNGDFTLKNINRENGIDWFYGQHDARWVSDDEILLFDNGNYRPSGSSIVSSRAVLYKIDEKTMEAEQIWQFPMGDVYAKFGSVQRIKSGNYVVCGGGTGSAIGPEPEPISSNIYEVTPENPGMVVWKIKLMDESVYKAYKYPSMYSNK